LGAQSEGANPHDTAGTLSGRFFVRFFGSFFGSFFWSRHSPLRPGLFDKKTSSSSPGQAESFPCESFLGKALLPTFLCSASCEVLRHAVIHLNQALHDSVGPTQCAVLLMLLHDGNKFVCESLQSLGDCFNSTDRVVGRRVTVAED
jgi:hypothetical protein